MNRTSTSARPLNWLFNGVQAVIGRGGQIAWSKVSAFFQKGRFTVKVNGAVAAGADSITVDVLEHAVPAGTSLDFGEYAPVTVKVNDADVNAGETSFGVDALTGPIPAGTRLEFSGAGAGYAQTSANAAAGATTLAVEALPEDIDDDATAEFAGGNIGAVTTADADAGDTTLAVSPVEFPIPDDAEANADYTGTNDKKFIPSGTFMVRDSDDKLFPRHDVTDGGETAFEILQSDAQEGALKDAKSGYGTLIEAQVFENLLPDADDSGNIPAGYKTEAAANGARFNYSDWSDDRATE